MSSHPHTPQTDLTCLAHLGGFYHSSFAFFSLPQGEVTEIFRIAVEREKVVLGVIKIR